MTTIRISADGKTIDPASFCCPTMSLHQAEPGMETLPFEMRVSTAHLIQLMNASYANFIREMLADAEAHGDADEALISSGYPATIPDLLQHPAALDLVFGRYLITEFLDKALPAPTANPRHFYLTPHRDRNECHCRLEGDEVLFSGACAREAA